MMRPPKPAGRRKTLTARPWKKPVSRSGASRKSSALRDGGVSSTSRSKSPSGVEVVELGDRGELLRAGDGARELLVDAVAEHLVARAARRARGARSARRTSAWRRASAPTARRASRCRAPRSARGRSARGSLPSSSSPSELASRRAGSIVTTATRAPLGGGAHRERGGRRGLAHAAGAGADDDPLAGDEVGDRGSDEPLADRVRDGLRAAAGVELRHDVVQHVLHGPLGIAELLRRPRASGARRRSATAPAARARSAGRRPACRCRPGERRRAGRAAGPCVTTPVPLAAARTAAASASVVSVSLRSTPTAPAWSAASTASSSQWERADDHAGARRLAQRADEVEPAAASRGRASTRSASNSAGRPRPRARCRPGRPTSTSRQALEARGQIRDGRSRADRRRRASHHPCRVRAARGLTLDARVLPSPGAAAILRPTQA